MNLKNIRYFLTLSKCLNFTQAAGQYHISQTAMSRYISSLEQQLGVKLFIRSSRTVQLTEAGKIFAKGMERILSEYSVLVEHTQDAANRFQGHIKVGIGIYEYANTENYFSNFLKMYSDIKVDIFQYSYSVLTQKFADDELDLMIALDLTRQEFRPDEILSEEFFESENMLVMAADKAAEYENISTEQILQNEYLVTNCEDEGPSSMKMLDALMKRDIGFMPDHIVQTNSLEAQLLMIKTGHGVAIVPAFLKEIHDSAYAVRSLPQKEPQHYSIIMKKNCRNPAAALFMHYCKDSLASGII